MTGETILLKRILRTLQGIEAEIRKLNARRES
jgi:hypothetical protein